jgi:hypothetical protein
MFTCVAALGLASALAACGGGSATTTSCGVPGRDELCECPTGPGIKKCGPDGTWTACTCGALSSGGGAGNGGSSAGQGGSTTGGTGGSSPTAGNGGGGNGGDMMMSNAGSGGDGMIDAGPMVTPLYAHCTNNGECTGDMQTCAKNPFGGGGGGGGGSGICTHPCTTSADCPPPASGNASALCSSSGVCLLTCSIGQTCPDGSMCPFGPGGISFCY